MFSAVVTTPAIEALAFRVAPLAIASAMPAAHRLSAVALRSADCLDELLESMRAFERSVDLRSGHVTHRRVSPHKHRLDVWKFERHFELCFQMRFDV